MKLSTHEAATADAGDPSPPAQSGEAPVTLRTFSQSLPMSLLRTREAVMRHFRASLRHYDLTEQQWRVLRALATAQIFEVTELAKATFLLAPSLSRIVRDLEARGLIERRSVQTDLRRAALSISPAGLRMIDLVSPDSEQIYRRITQAYGTDKLQHLQSLLRDLERCVLEMPPRS